MELTAEEWPRSPETNPLSRSDIRRFLGKVRVGDECWNWQAAKVATGYGQFWWRGKMRSAHRMAWLILVGPFPDGLEVDHLCRNTSCVRPDHLEWVTHQENTRRSNGAKPTPTHCPQGHEYTPENAAYWSSKASRQCRACYRARYREWEKKVGRRRVSQ